MQPNITISSLDAERIEALIHATRPETATSRGLLAELTRADILEPEEMPHDVVTMNSTVRFEITGTDEVRTLTLAYPKDMAQQPDSISILTPIGAALLGLSVGDTIDWPRPDGQLVKVRLLDILYQPERAGEYFR
ncbi:nucleoside diphosphate kinase regulator [Duganella sp. CY15W]|uniref:nucleoside diphosphate kinase regulator n=1 Tax=Duganella sp. CY15W TaxID=2692172 RepID=UPI00136E35E6|nr:nucleoside diphosphate kinase regulator [Duganella sp. CY15W]MYM28592.1 nucleoside diphosphate kinase regulator [Duganella sp. CY15W]